MTYTTACFHPSLPIRLAVLFLLAYPFVVWLLSTHRTGIGPIAASAVPLALTPLLIGASVGWLGITHVFERMAIAGGGRASSAAGFSEIFVMIAFSSAIGGLVTGIAWFRDAIRRSHHQAPVESPEERQPVFTRVKTLTGVLTTLALASLVGQMVIARQTVYNTPAPAAVSPKFAAVVGLVMLFAAIIALGWLVASRRTSAPQFYSHRRALALSCAISIALCYAAWHLVDEFRTIAIVG